MKKTNSGPKFETESPENESALKQLFTDGIQDLYWAENHLVKALPKMEAAASSGELKKALNDHLGQTKTHVARLEKIFSLLEKDPIAKKCDAMQGLTLEGEQIVESTPEGTPARDTGIILASQKVEHYEIASYGGLAQLATALGMTDAAGILEETLAEEKEADSLLTKIAETSINHTNSDEASTQ